MSLHKVKVQALCFSNDEKYLASLGGQDDNSLVIWDLNTGRPLCGGTPDRCFAMVQGALALLQTLNSLFYYVDC